MPLTRTAELIDCFSVYDFDHLTTATIQHAKNALYDVLGAQLAATSRRYPIISLLENLATQVGGTPESTVIGTPLKTNATTAALVNGTLAYYCDIESHHPSANVHAVAVVGPAALAVAERCEASGAATLAAIVAGIDVAARVSYALGPAQQYARGLHPSTIAGTFGAAVAAGRLLRLTDEQFAHALGLASTSTSGLLSWVDDPSEQSRPLNIGLAAQSGTQASLLAALGFQGPPDAFAGKYPFGHAYTGQWDQHALLDQIGARYEVSELFFKRNSCCVFIPAALDGLLDIMATENLSPTAISSIAVRAPKSSFQVIDANPLRSHCLQYVLAIAGHQGHVYFDDIMRDRRDEASIRDLSEKITLVGDDEIDRRSAPGHQSVGSITTVLTHDGREVTRDIEFPLGASENPLSQVDLEQKFRRLTADVISPDTAAAITVTTHRIERLGCVRELTELLTTGSNVTASTRS
jgi:2-methylcitrate dehydratase PrpD